MSAFRERIKSVGHKWTSNILWLLFKYNKFRRYCSESLSVKAVHPFKWCHWHDGARCFTAILKNNDKTIFIKTDSAFHMIENEYRMSRLFYKGLPMSCPYIEYADLNGPIKVIVFEYVRGCTLEDFLSTQYNVIYWPHFFDELLKILDNLYQLNMIHRDITPSNLLIQKDSGKKPFSIKLIDFAFGVITGETCIDSQIEKSKVMYLGQSLNPKPYLWDDAYSSLQILKKIEKYSGHYFPEWREQFEKRVGLLTHAYGKSVSGE